MVEIAVIVPAYNEEKTVGRVVEAFHRELPGAQIVVVENGSTDATESVARASLRRFGCEGTVITEPRRGKGNAVRRAFLEVDADVYVLVDADMTYPAQQVRDLLRPVQDGQADMSVGERFTREQYHSSTNRPMHAFGNRLVRQLVNVLFRGNVADVMSGYRVLSRQFVKTCPVLADGFQIETEMTLHALDKRFRLVEIPVDYLARPPGSKSKVRTVRDGARVLLTILRALRQYRPMAFFSSVALFLALCAFMAGVPVWFSRELVWNVPLALLVLGFALLALGSMGTGLILDWIAYDKKQSFEYCLLQMRMHEVPHRVSSQPRVKPDRAYVRAV